MAEARTAAAPRLEVQTEPQPEARTEEQAAAPTGATPAGDSERGYRVPGTAADEIAAIRQHAPLVKRLAAHLRGRLPDSVQLDDLVQTGLIAVLRTMRSGAAQAMSEAALRRTIVNAMIDEARRESWTPVRTLRLTRLAAAAMQAVKRRTGRDGSDEEVAAEMRIPLAEFHRILVAAAGTRLIELDACAEGAEAALRVAGSQDAAVHRKRMTAALAAAVAGLPEREKLVMSLYYEQELNMEEVGRVMGLDKSTVCRAHGRALLILREALGGGDAAAFGPWSEAGG